MEGEEQGVGLLVIGYWVSGFGVGWTWLGFFEQSRRAKFVKEGVGFF